MDYKAESVELGFGKGIAISRAGETYEQIQARDGLTVRLFQAQNKANHYDANCHGIILKPSFNYDEQDFQVFKDLTDRLTKVSGEEIKNSPLDFGVYILHDGLEQKLERRFKNYTMTISIIMIGLILGLKQSNC